MTEEEIILPEDPRAAIECTLVPRDPVAFKGFCPWLSRHGRIFNDEASARWDGATHLTCYGCGKPFDKNSFCQPCAAKRAEERYMALPSRDWRDGAMICDGEETFIDTFDELADLVYQNPKATGRHWVFARKCDDFLLELHELTSDYTCDGFEFSDETYSAANRLEDLVRRDLSSGIWLPSDTRVTFGTFNAWLAEQEKAYAKL